MTPGPTPVPPEVLAATAEPVVHHRSPDFRVVLERCLGRLAQVFRTELPVLMFTSSGTAAMESAVANLVSPGDRGHGRLVRLLRRALGSHRECVRRRCRCARVRVGRVPSADELARDWPSWRAKVVFLTHSETSTGVVADVRALAAVARESGALVVVDAISSLGAVPLESDAWGIDVVCSGSQKALMTPPGPRVRLRLGRGETPHAERRRASTSTGSAHGRPRRSSTQPSRLRSRSSRGSTSRSGCCSTRASRPRSSGTCASAARAGRARRRWASSSSHPTTTARRS